MPMNERIEAAIEQVKNWTKSSEKPGIEGTEVFVGSADNIDFLVISFFYTDDERGFTGTATVAGALIIKLSDKDAKRAIACAKAQLTSIIDLT